VVNLNDDDEVQRAAQEAHQQMMHLYETQRINEASAKRARQGGRTYNFRGRHSFILDAARQTFYGKTDPEREKRLRDHGFEVQKSPAYHELRELDEALGQGGSFVPPAYFQSEFQAAAHPERAVANLCRRLPLTAKTMQINVPTFTGGSSVGVDYPQGISIVETDPTDALVSSSVVTIAGKVTASRQVLDQSPQDSRVDELINADIGEAYGAQLDSSVLTGAGGTGQMLGLLNLPNVATVAAGSSVAGLVDGVSLGAQTVVQTRYKRPDCVIMHPRRWYGTFGNAIDVNGRPLQLPTTNPNALSGTPDDGVAAEWLGMKVVLDVNMPITSGNGSQDFVIVGYSRDWLLYESQLQFNVFRETLANQLGVILSGWQYAALAVRYPSSVCLVGPFNAPTTPGS
jgi:HK97 family phage major capsid protein